MKPRIFIGSSTKGKRIVGALQTALDNAGYDYEITPWYQGVFALSETTIESLEKMLDDSDYAILVLTPDDLVVKNDEVQISSRDNVILEFGLFCGRLGRKKTFILCEKNANINLPSDLLGVTVAYFDNHENDNDLLNSLSKLAFQLNISIVESKNDNQLLKNINICVEKYIKKYSPNLSSNLDSTACTFLPRILQLACEDEYYTKLERKTVITPDECGNSFHIEIATAYTIHTNSNSYIEKSWNWYNSKRDRDSIHYSKFVLDEEDRLNEYNSLREFKTRSRRDYVNSFAVRHKPVAYHNAHKSHTVEIETTRERKVCGFHVTHAMFSTLARNINIAFQLSGRFSENWEIKVHLFSAFKYAESPYIDEYKQTNTTTHSVHINCDGWALPGWGYYYTIQPKKED